MLRHITQALVAFGPAGIFLLAVLDSAGVPLPAAMDALLILVAVKTPDRAWLTAAMATAGSFGGNVGLYWAARRGGERWMREPEPGGRPEQFRRWFTRYGLLTVFIPALLPIPLPLKVFVVSAGVLRTSFAEFAAVVLIARLMRYFCEADLGIRLGENAPGFLRSHGWTIALIAVGLTAALYGGIRWSERRRGYNKP